MTVRVSHALGHAIRLSITIAVTLRTLKRRDLRDTATVLITLRYKVDIL